MNGAMKDEGECLVQDMVLTSKEPNIIKFQGEKGQDEVKSWYRENLKEEFGGRGPNRRDKKTEEHANLLKKKFPNRFIFEQNKFSNIT